MKVRTSFQCSILTLCHWGNGKLTINFPDLKKHLLDEKRNIRSFVNIFVGDNDIRHLQQEKTVVRPDTIISIVPAIAGGYNRRL